MGYQWYRIPWSRIYQVGQRVNGQGSPDGRTERWRKHREQRREEFLDATFRALQRHGPEVTMADIAAEAGVAKPRLYRYFSDKSDLFDAVAARTLRTVWDRLLPTLDADTPPLRIVRNGVNAYVGLVDEHPNVVRFLLDSRFVERSWEADPVVGNKRKIATMLAEFFIDTLRLFRADPNGAQPWAYAVVGAVVLPTEWWLENRGMTREQLVDYLTTFVWGAVDAALRSEGIVLDPDEPVNVASLAHS